MQKIEVSLTQLRKENPDLTKKQLQSLYVRLRRKADPERHRKHLECKKRYKERKKAEKVVKPQEQKTDIMEDKEIIQMINVIKPGQRMIVIKGGK